MVRAVPIQLGALISDGCFTSLRLGLMLCTSPQPQRLCYGLDLISYGCILPSCWNLRWVRVDPGSLGLLWLNKVRNTRGEQNQGMDITFLWLLLATSVTGLIIAGRYPMVGYTSVLAGVVMTLFLTMPYGKFIHGFYRLIALVAFAMEQEEHQARVIVEQIPIKNVG